MRPLERFTQVKSRKVYVQVVEQIIDLIERGTFPPGTQMPPERDLARTLGISRASLREALTVLQLRGLVETRPGQGTVVSDGLGGAVGRASLGNLNEGESPFSILQARKALEPSVAYLAALRGSHAAIASLEHILDWVNHDPARVQVLSDVFSDGDRKFHLAIAVATQNPVLVRMQRIVHGLMGQTLWLTLMRRSSFGTPDRWRDATKEHRLLFEAIQDRQPELARQRAEAHLETVERIMVEADLSPESAGDEGHGN